MERHSPATPPRPAAPPRRETKPRAGPRPRRTHPAKPPRPAAPTPRPRRAARRSPATKPDEEGVTARRGSRNPRPAEPRRRAAAPPPVRRGDRSPATGRGSGTAPRPHPAAPRWLLLLRSGGRGRLATLSLLDSCCLRGQGGALLRDRLRLVLQGADARLRRSRVRRRARVPHVGIRRRVRRGAGAAVQQAVNVLGVVNLGTGLSPYRLFSSKDY